MRVFVLKRKLYAEPGMVMQQPAQYQQQQQNSGGGLGRKLAIGAGGVLATAGTFYGARKGMLGKNLRQSSNNLWGKAGGWLNRQGWFGKTGENMMKSAKKDWTTATRDKILAKNVNAGKNVSTGAIQKQAETQANRIETVWSKGREEGRKELKNVKNAKKQTNNKPKSKGSYVDTAATGLDAL